MAGGKHGLVLSARPKSYKTLPQQKRMKKAAEACNIRKGMTRAELLTAMTTCLPKFFAKEKENDGQSGA